MTANIIKEVFVLYEEIVELNVEDYLSCETIHDLEYTILRKFDLTKDLKKEYTTNREKIKISEDFMLKWKAAVGFLPGNVMTLSRKNRCISLATDIKEFDGYELNQMKAKNYLNSYDFRDYQDFHFDVHKRYKVYLRDSDQGYYSSSTILFAEECGPSVFVGSDVILGS